MYIHLQPNNNINFTLELKMFILLRCDLIVILMLSSFDQKSVLLFLLYQIYLL